MKFLALIFALLFVSTAPGTKSPWGIAFASSTTEAALARIAADMTALLKQAKPDAHIGAAAH